jgi:probable F420-dependent oxidoreductase
MAVRLGLFLPQYKQFQLARDVVHVARAAEEIGYDGVWVYERVLVPENSPHGLYGVPGLPWPDYYRSLSEPLVTLTAAAAVTERVRLGTAILVAPMHQPFQLARSLATLDAVSGGRVAAGFGTGWSVDEYAAASFAPFEQRGAVLDELLDVCAAIWGPNPVTYEGQYVTIRESEVGPKPVRPIPIYLAGNAPKALRRVARRGDGWVSAGMPPAALADTLRQLNDEAAELGRGPNAIEGIVRAPVVLSEKPIEGADRAMFTGSIEQVIQDTIASAEAGAHEVTVDLGADARDAAELLDLAARVHAEVRAAGV